jgi:hypothetical protein
MSMRLVPLALDWNNFAARDDRSFVLPGTALDEPRVAWAAVLLQKSRKRHVARAASSNAFAQTTISKYLGQGPCKQPFLPAMAEMKL